jgi:hypothetical protein
MCARFILTSNCMGGFARMLSIHACSWLPKLNASVYDHPFPSLCCSWPSSMILSQIHCAGQCRACQDCGAEFYLKECGGMSPGQCKACTVCGPNEYEVSPYTAKQDRVCASCASLPSCSDNSYRMCGHGHKTECQSCEICTESGQYRVGCGGLSQGQCEACETCPAGQVTFAAYMHRPFTQHHANSMDTNNIPISFEPAYTKFTF